MTAVLPQQRADAPPETTGGQFGDVRLMEGLYVFAVAQTVLFNPVLLSVGGLSVYASAVTWAFVACVALLQWTSTTDGVLLAANRRLAVVVWVSLCAIGVQVLLMGPQVYTADSLGRLLYAPLGIFVAFSVYSRIERILDITIGIVGIECLLLVLPRLGSPVDLSNRLNPASLGGRNDFGAFLMILIVLRVSLWAYDRRRPRLYVLLGLGSSLVALVLTLSRSPTLGLVVGLAVVSLSSMFRRGITGRSLRSAAIVGTVLAPFLWQPAVRARLASVDLTNSSGRNDIWAAAVELFRRRPLAGHGFGSFDVTSPHIVEDFVTSGPAVPVDPNVGRATSSAHNVVLQILAEGGVVGLVVVGWCIAHLLRACWHTVLLPVAVAIFVDALFDTFAYVVQVSWVLGLVFALGLKLRSDQARSTSPEPAGAALGSI